MLSAKIPYRVSNRMEAAPLEAVRFGGAPARLAAQFFEKRIFSDHAKETVFAEAESAFSDPRDDETLVGYWRGEFWGKWIISAVEVCRYSGNAQLREFLRDAAHRLLTFQHEDGYLGSYRDPDNVISPDPVEAEKVCGWRCNWNWNIWCRKYTFWGLLECAMLLDDAEILAGCRRIADHLIDQLERLGLSPADTGTFNGLPTGSIMKPMLVLYRLTGEQRYLDLCLRIAEDWDREDGMAPNLIANARSGLPLHEWYDNDPNGKPMRERYDGDQWAKAYEMMSCLEGLAELYRVTGIQKYFDTVRIIYDLLLEHELNAVFSVGYNDLFAHAAAEINAISEPCDVIHWMRVSHDLFTLTGESRYMDAMERAWYNAFLAGVFRDGEWASRGVRSSGRHLIARQMDYLHNHCCVNNIPRGFMTMARSAVMKGDGALWISLFGDFDATLSDSAGQDVVSVRGSFARDCRAEISVEHQSASAETLRLRVPDWSLESRIIVNGVEHTPAPGSWFRTELAPWSVNAIEIVYDNRPVLREFPREIIAREDSDWKVRRWINENSNPFACNGVGARDTMVFEPRCTLMMGPILLARSKRIGCTEPEIFSAPSLAGQSASCTLEPIPFDGQCAFRATFTLPDGDVLATNLCDYAFAANEISEDPHLFSIWL